MRLALSIYYKFCRSSASGFLLLWPLVCSQTFIFAQSYYVEVKWMFCLDPLYWLNNHLKVDVFQGLRQRYFPKNKSMGWLPSRFYSWQFQGDASDESSFFCSFFVYYVNKIEPGYNIFYTIACATSADSDHSAHLSRLIRVFAPNEDTLDHWLPYECQDTDQTALGKHTVL